MKEVKINKRGYILIYMPCHPFHDKKGYVFEHRLIAEQCLKRLLTKEETVHHINFYKDDNRKENLAVFPSQKEHMKFHKKLQQFGYTRHLQRQLEELRLK